MTTSLPLRGTAAAAALAAATAAVLAVSAPSASAASSKGCDGGGFRVTTAGAAVSPGTTTTLPAARVDGTTIQVRGTFQQFDVDPATLSVRHFVFTGAANKLDMTGGVPTEAFAAKTADLRGATLTSALSVAVDKDGTLALSRTGAGVSMKITGKDCAAGGIFQMEPERADGTATTFTHVLGAGVFYFDNLNFRARLGEVLNGTTVTARVNFANDTSRNFVGRDSTQLATRLSQTGTTSTWSVQSGGRMGQVMGEDATEVAPAATACDHKCGAQNQTKGAATVLGFPFPVPAASRL
jgi:hypothetical protein